MRIEPADLDRLAILGVQWSDRPLQLPPESARWVDEPAPGAAQCEQLTAALAPLVADEVAAHGYRSRDLVVLHPGTPGLEGLLERFEQPHTHADDEVRYIVDGEGLFGFFDAGGEVVVQVEAGDYLRVPAGLEHRFTLTARRRLKALRLFTDPAGWVAQNTGRAVVRLQALAPRRRERGRDADTLGLCQKRID